MVDVYTPFDTQMRMTNKLAYAVDYDMEHEEGIVAAINRLQLL